MNINRLYDCSVYSLDCVQAAIYKFNFSVSCKIDLKDNYYSCTFTAIQSSLIWDEFFIEFDRELIDQELRKKLSLNASEYRNIILSLAFAKTGLQSDEQI